VTEAVAPLLKDCGALGSPGPVNPERETASSEIRSRPHNDLPSDIGLRGEVTPTKGEAIPTNVA